MIGRECYTCHIESLPWFDHRDPTLSSKPRKEVLTADSLAIGAQCYTAISTCRRREIRLCPPACDTRKFLLTTTLPMEPTQLLLDNEGYILILLTRCLFTARSVGRNHRTDSLCSSIMLLVEATGRYRIRLQHRKHVRRLDLHPR